MYEEIKAYTPYNVQEEKDRKTILAFLEKYPDAFERSNELAHMTSSAWVTNRDHNRILMAYHNIYDSWSWLGGHCDGNTNCLEVAIREVKEEAGITSVTPLSDKIFSLEVLSVNAHMKRGSYVPTHLHLNVTYLLEADDQETLVIKEDENANVAWFLLDEALHKSTEKWFVEHIYAKLNQKLRKTYEID